METARLFINLLQLDVDKPVHLKSEPARMDPSVVPILQPPALYLLVLVLDQMAL